MPVSQGAGAAYVSFGCSVVIASTVWPSCRCDLAKLQGGGGGVAKLWVRGRGYVAGAAKLSCGCGVVIVGMVLVSCGCTLCTS